MHWMKQKSIESLMLKNRMSMVNIKIVNPPVEAVKSMTTISDLHKASINICIKIGYFLQVPRQGIKPFIS